MLKVVNVIKKTMKRVLQKSYNLEVSQNPRKTQKKTIASGTKNGNDQKENYSNKDDM